MTITKPRKHYTEARFLGFLILLVVGAYAVGALAAALLPVTADRATRTVYAVEVAVLLGSYLREKDRP